MARAACPRAGSRGWGGGGRRRRMPVGGWADQFRAELTKILPAPVISALGERASLGLLPQAAEQVEGEAAARAQRRTELAARKAAAQSAQTRARSRLKFSWVAVRRLRNWSPIVMAPSLELSRRRPMSWRSSWLNSTGDRAYCRAATGRQDRLRCGWRWIGGCLRARRHGAGQGGDGGACRGLHSEAGRGLPAEMGGRPVSPGKAGARCWCAHRRSSPSLSYAATFP